MARRNKHRPFEQTMALFTLVKKQCIFHLTFFFTLITINVKRFGKRKERILK